MYAALLRAQWRSVGGVLLILSAIAFAIPVSQILFSSVAGTIGAPEDALGIMATITASSGAYPIVALLTGALLAVSCWADDSQGKHIYALALPVPRWYYLLLRIAVGMTWIAVTVASLWLAALISTSQLTLPVGLRSYPGALAVRFALAAALTFSVVFAVGSASARIQRGLGIAFVAFFLILGFAAAMGFGPSVEFIMKIITSRSGLFDIFVGRWLLIDV
jgi:hypothetical protein